MPACLTTDEMLPLLLLLLPEPRDDEAPSDDADTPPAPANAAARLESGNEPTLIGDDADDDDRDPGWYWLRDSG